MKVRSQSLNHWDFRITIAAIGWMWEFGRGKVKNKIRRVGMVLGGSGSKRQRSSTNSNKLFPVFYSLEPILQTFLLTFVNKWVV